MSMTMHLAYSGNNHYDSLFPRTDLRWCESRSAEAAAEAASEAALPRAGVRPRRVAEGVHGLRVITSVDPIGREAASASGRANSSDPYGCGSSESSSTRTTPNLTTTTPECRKNWPGAFYPNCASSTASSYSRGSSSFMNPDRIGLDTGTSDKRGGHDHSKSKDKRSHVQIAKDHADLVGSFTIGRPCTDSCAFNRKCGLMFTPANFLRCHDSSFGLPEAPLLQKATHSFWKRLATAATYSADGVGKKKKQHFTVDGIGPVCIDFWAAAYGVTKSAKLTILAAARKRRTTGGS